MIAAGGKVLLDIYVKKKQGGLIQISMPTGCQGGAGMDGWFSGIRRHSPAAS
jgi:hypothetical protein